MNDIYLSFFMFTTNLKPDDLDYRNVIVNHIRNLEGFGYTGFEFPIAPGEREFFEKDLQDYTNLRKFIDDMGLEHIQIATNVGATPQFDPSSSNPEQRQEALEYLKSRVDITAALRGKIMMGPIIVPYAAFPTRESDQAPLWSDELQDALEIRYRNAQPILEQLGEYAEEKNVKLAIEPITHWETPGPNKLSQLLEFLDGISSRQVGVVIDSAHEILDGDGPEIFSNQVRDLAAQDRLHYIQISAADRGAVHTSWLPWQAFLEPILPVYNGPIAIEVFNAIPDFVKSLHLTRRKFWIPDEDPENQYPSAYEIAQKAYDKTQAELKKFRDGY
ncbi:MAG: sugar phosphate isomerase/epimerase family protein [Planktothrix sp.]|uniref:sugar phosphate isomerase/epimerase family protein n=1 Tax=Planktothrix sp. TaxID=3088171 RepID=UPI0038D4A236